MKSINAPSRRFIRIEALNNLYVYHITRQIVYDECIEQINKDFVPNSIAEQVENKFDLKKDTEESIQLLKIFIKNEKEFSTFTHSKARILSSVKNAFYLYKSTTSTNSKNAKKFLEKVESDINQAYLTTLQLLLEWRKLSSNKDFLTNKTPKQLQFIHKFQCNSFLTKLNTDLYFQESVKIHKVDWKKESYLIEDLFKSICIDSENFDICDTNIDDSTFIFNFLSDIFFKSPSVIDFFERKYLLWHRFDYLVKGILQNMLKNYIADIENKIKFTEGYLFFIDKQNSDFYNRLIDTFILQETEVDKVLEERLENWDLERVIFLDRIIAKLALCEILFFIEIPRRVSINEYIDIAKLYGSEQSGKFINGVLDPVNPEKP